MKFDAAERSFDFRPDFRGEVFSLQFIPNLRAIFRRKIYQIEVDRLDRVVGWKKKRECSREDKDAGEAHNARDDPRETGSSISMDERLGDRSLRKTSNPNSGIRRVNRQ